MHLGATKILPKAELRFENERELTMIAEHNADQAMARLEQAGWDPNGSGGVQWVLGLVVGAAVFAQMYVGGCRPPARPEYYNFFQNYMTALVVWGMSDCNTLQLLFIIYYLLPTIYHWANYWHYSVN